MNAMGDNIFLLEIPPYLRNGLNFDIKQSDYVSSLPYLFQFFGSFVFSFASDFALNKGVSLKIIPKIGSTIAYWGSASILLTLYLIKSADKTVAIALVALTLGIHSAISCSVLVNEMDISPNFAGVLTSIIYSLCKISELLVPYIIDLIVTDSKIVDQWYWLFYLAADLWFMANVIFVIFGSVEVQPWNEPVSTIKFQIEANKVEGEQKVFARN